MKRHSTHTDLSNRKRHKKEELITQQPQIIENFHQFTTRVFDSFCKENTWHPCEHLVSSSYNGINIKHLTHEYLQLVHRWNGWLERPKNFIPYDLLLEDLCEYFFYYDLIPYIPFQTKSAMKPYWREILDYVKPEGYLDLKDQSRHQFIEKIVSYNPFKSGEWFHLKNTNEYLTGAMYQISSHDPVIEDIKNFFNNWIQDGFYIEYKISSQFDCHFETFSDSESTYFLWDFPLKEDTS